MMNRLEKIETPNICMLLANTKKNIVEWWQRRQIYIRLSNSYDDIINMVCYSTWLKLLVNDVLTTGRPLCKLGCVCCPLNFSLKFSLAYNEQSGEARVSHIYKSDNCFKLFFLICIGNYRIRICRIHWSTPQCLH